MIAYSFQLIEDDTNDIFNGEVLTSDMDKAKDMVESIAVMCPGWSIGEIVLDKNYTK